MSDQPVPDTTVLRPGAPPAGSDDALPVGTRLHEFEIVGLIGIGGFGIVYQAYDHSLQRTVALKEYMPSALAVHTPTIHVTLRAERHAETFQAGLRSFVNEARLLAAFDHPSLVKVYQFWEANGTAYMVMPFYRGPTLKQVLRERATPPDEMWLTNLLAALLDALELLHGERCYHRDIAPDNILILADGRPLLLDFGAARRAIAGKADVFTVILKQDYAPVEQYADIPSMVQGPWTDIYALGANVCLAITGKPPPPAVSRMVADPQVPLALQAAGRYSPRFLNAIDQALAVRPDDRPQSVARLRTLLGIDGPALGSQPVVASGRRGRRAAIATAAAVGLLALGAVIIPRVNKPDTTPVAVAAPFDPVRALDDVFQARNRNHAVTISIEQSQVRIGTDPLRFAIRSSRPGHVYVLMVGTDRSQFWLLFPNALDQDNRIAADTELALPRATWRMVAGGPPGANQFLAIVSDAPRDFSGAGLKRHGAFGAFPLAGPRAGNGTFAGKAVCAATAPPCSAAYGAAVFSIAEVR